MRHLIIANLRYILLPQKRAWFAFPLVAKRDFVL